MKITDIAMIHKIIDDAMEKKERSVSIFIMGDSTSVNVYPYETGLQKWIQTYEDTKDHRISRATYRCPNCGAVSKYATPYCSICGEQLRV